MNDSIQMQILREVYHNLSHPSTPNDLRPLVPPAPYVVDSQQPRPPRPTDDAAKPDHVLDAPWKPAPKTTESSEQSDEQLQSTDAALEQDFAIAVFEIGLRQSSPKVLKGLMLPADGGGLTTEHIKSHLQKYRLHYERSKEEFLGHYRKYLRLDRGDGSSPSRASADDDDDAADVDDRRSSPALSASGKDHAAAAASSSRGGGNASSSSSPFPNEGRQDDESRDVAQLVRVQNVHNQLVHEQLELQNTLQAQMHEQLQLQAELNALMRDAVPLYAAGDSGGGRGAGAGGLHHPQHHDPGGPAAPGAL